MKQLKLYLPSLIIFGFSCLLLIQYACDKDNEVENKATITDYDGNTYNTIKIGNQLWMAENLKTTHYADGAIIPLVEDGDAWDNLSTADKAYCYYDNSSSNGNTYGALYTWAAAMNSAASSDNNPSGIQGVCPSGWHLPSDDEWKELEMYLGMPQADLDRGMRGTNEGSKLAGNANLWDDGDLVNDTAFGTSGFMALPGGGRIIDGSFFQLGNSAFFWSATECDSSWGLVRRLISGLSESNRGCTKKDFGSSVRCIKDN